MTADPKLIARVAGLALLLAGNAHAQRDDAPAARPARGEDARI